MYIKIDENGMIVGHDYIERSGYVKVSENKIYDTERKTYRYKRVDDELVLLSEDEVYNHPLAKQKRIRAKLSEDRRKMEITKQITSWDELLTGLTDPEEISECQEIISALEAQL